MNRSFWNPKRWAPAVVFMLAGHVLDGPPPWWLRIVLGAGLASLGYFLAGRWWSRPAKP